jgi:hypothetical protein
VVIDSVQLGNDIVGYNVRRCDAKPALTIDIESGALLSCSRLFLVFVDCFVLVVAFRSKMSVGVNRRKRVAMCKGVIHSREISLSVSKERDWRSGQRSLFRRGGGVEEEPERGWGVEGGGLNEGSALPK